MLAVIVSDISVTFGPLALSTIVRVVVVPSASFVASILELRKPSTLGPSSYASDATVSSTKHETKVMVLNRNIVKNLSVFIFYKFIS